ncbi:MarR family transcriptional regulator [Streptomyces sp. NBC_01351]|uniref:MarR family winged helix-turn-helix transcriptional regulator n=1 Tax=Streptomyces sp. NBC_01351 TaxID=2903833 RepID=UPI002E345445|nr:MarR family transcriptional regulator [Streptomyces sp. NBC_01351]
MTSGRAVAAATGPVGYALSEAAKAHRAQLQLRVGPLGLHLGQELLLVDVHEHPGTTQAELVQRLGFEQPTVAKAITRMERTGFVARAADPADRRVTRLRLTERGEAAVQEVVTAWADADRASTSGLTEAETTELTRILNKIRDNRP